MSEKGLGVQNVLRSGVSVDHPFTFAETAGGLLLLANGIDPILRWDGLAGTADAAGVQPPATAMQLGGTQVGYITGTLVAYQRFIDANGNVSDLSPVSNTMEAGSDGLIDSLDYDRTTGVVTVVSQGHGLTTGETLLIDDVEGLTLVNGQWTVTVVDADSFTLNNLTITSGTYTQGGYWTLGIKNVVYGAVPLPTESKVVRRQILRNLSGSLDSLYVDIDTTNLTATAFVSTAVDETLAAGQAVPLTHGDGDLPYANRYGVPPSHKAVIVAHKGRIFAAADASYSVGHAEVAFGSTQVQGVGTNWKSNFAGRLIYFSGAISAYQIAAVNPTTQVLTLTAPYQDPPAPYFLYSIRPDPGERRLVYYSEPGNGEAWPAYNAIAIPEDNDVITGLVSLGQYLYVLENRHIYRTTWQSFPGDGMAFLCAQRGTLNNRTYAVTDMGIFALDEIGVHRFDGGDPTPISQPIQNVFQDDGTSDVQVDWTSDQSVWHAAHDPARDTVRWFVTMIGYDAPYHAISYNYRTDRWWIEQYPTAMTSSANATIGSRRSLAGTEARRVVCLSQGAYDGVSGDGTLRGSPTSADQYTLTDSTAAFDALEGAPISIVAGTGRGQQRIVASNTATQVTVAQGWDTIPDSTSVYQIGGIAWQWRSGWFRYMQDETEQPRDVDVVFMPLSTPTNMDIQLYFDHSVEPRNWSRSITQDFVTTVDGDPHITVDLSAGIGWARQRISGHADRYSHGDRFVSVELSGVQAGETVRVSQVILSDVEPS